jgi:hypothetical protein
MQQLPDLSDTDSAPLPTTAGAALTGTDLDGLLLRYSELSRDVARMRRLLEDLVQHVDSPGLGHRVRAQGNARQLTSSHDHDRRPMARSTSRRSSGNGKNVGPVGSKLERACRIALMETYEPVSVETIYDRIERRGSFTFAGYKHPFRAIVLAMGAMVRHGEASLCIEEEHRRWRWETPLEQPAFVTVPDGSASVVPRS